MRHILGTTTTTTTTHNRKRSDLNNTTTNSYSSMNDSSIAELNDLDNNNNNLMSASGGALRRNTSESPNFESNNNNNMHHNNNSSNSPASVSSTVGPSSVSSSNGNSLVSPNNNTVSNNNANNISSSSSTSTAVAEKVALLEQQSNTNENPFNFTNYSGDSSSDQSSSSASVENKVRNSADQNCWNMFVLTSWTAFACFIVLIWSQWTQSGGEVQTHSLEYFILCMIGGVLSGLPHFILTPFDQIKCRMQTGEFGTAVEGFKNVWNDPVNKGMLSLRITALYRGWVPTLIGYSLQGATKFGLYEYLKWALKASVGPEFAKEHQVVLFLLSSALAEFCADILLAPWEAVKVKMQTNAALLSGGGALTSQVVPRMYSLEGFHGFFKGLPPLWMRQVPYTMTKFATFEKTVEFFYFYIIRATKRETAPGIQLLVSLLSGFVAGFFCTVVSHPADTVVSKLNQKQDSRVGAWQVMQDLGCAGLWKGLLARIMFVGTLTGMQWLIYDSFKVLVGLQTTGGGPVAPPSAPGGMQHLGDAQVGAIHHNVRHLQQQGVGGGN